MVQIPLSKQPLGFRKAKLVPSGRQLWIKQASRAAFVGGEAAHSYKRELEAF